MQYVDVPPGAGKRAMVDLGMPEWLVDGYIELIGEFADACRSRMCLEFATLTGHPARPFEHFARDFASVFGGAKQAAAGTTRT